MKKGDARGLSTIIATLLIILLVILSIAIVWGVIRNIIINNAEKISLGKFTIDLEIVSMKQTAQDVNIKVKRNAGEGELEGIVFSIFDGKETHIYEKKNITLNPLEVKTFVVDYQGQIVSISIYPIFVTDSGKKTIGNIADTYYNIINTGEQLISSGCTPDCTGKECGDNGCGGSCGTCSGLTPHCVLGECKAESGGNPNCSCSTITCSDKTCSDGLEGSCPGLLQPDCNNNQIMCGASLNGCNCGTCDTGYYCNGGVCSRSCLASDCGLRECGTLPGRIDCGETFCGLCTIQGETCNITSGVCFQCIPDCTNRNCGVDPVCGSSCGTCNTLIGEYCNLAGSCVRDTILNNGTIYSIWPEKVGIYFDSEDLPKSGDNYVSYWARFPGSNEFSCLHIDKFVIPYIPEIYNRSYIKFVQTSSNIAPGDSYEIWETYNGCTS